jgi:hydrogenase 3 maturation protease
VSTLKAALKNRLHKIEKIALLGVGSDLRGDDAAGILVAEHLHKSSPKDIKQQRLKVFFGSSAPENLTGEIKRFSPDYLVIVDSANIGKRAGAVKLINPDEVEGFSFCTHRLPLKIMTDYLIKTINCKILIIGIQPGRLDFASRPSKEVEKSAKYISDTIEEILKE